MVLVGSPGVALEGLALVAGTWSLTGNQHNAVQVDKGGEAELRSCDACVHGPGGLSARLL
jgi:hypothetical protein